MQTVWPKIVKTAKLGSILALGVLAGALLPTTAFNSATNVLASFAGVVVAALVPTMILAATILRPVSKGKKEFGQIRAAVSRQISFFSGLFLLTIVLAALLFGGALLGWKDISLDLPLGTGERQWVVSIPVTRLIGGGVVSLSALIAAQMVGFVHGVRSLFHLHANNAEIELDRIIANQNAAVLQASLPSDPRTRVGENIGELKH